jgi:hypothetical protein
MESKLNPDISTYSSSEEEKLTILRRVRMTCDLFNLAFEMKSLELERRFPDASEAWIKQETLRLIEAGTR